ncbi:MAG: polysaccharide biosynthesis tyrosine autokinase [Silvibacterium sp.]
MDAERLLEESSESSRHNSLRLTTLEQMYGLPARERSLRDYWHILQKRKWTVVVSIVVVFVMAGIISVRMTPIYDGVTIITIFQRASNPLNIKDSDNSQGNGDQALDLDTQVKILESDTLAELVIHRLNLDARPEFAGQAQTQNSGGIAISESPTQDREREEQLIRKFQKSLKVVPIPNTSLINIKYSNPDPSLAADVANAITATFIEQNFKSRYDSTMQAADWLSKQLADLQIKVESSQAKLVQYQRDHGIVGADDKQNLTIDKLDELNKELTQAQADRIQKESLYQVAVSSNPEGLSAVLQDPLLTALRQQQTQLQAQYALLSTQFGPGYPKVLEIKNQLDQVDRSYKEQVQDSVNRIQNDYQTAVSRERMLQAALTEQTGVADQLSQNAIEYKALKQEADSNRQLYDGLLQKLKEASLSAGLESSNVRIVDRARVPLHPARPNIPMNLEFALLIGLVGGVAIAFVLEALDTTVRTPDQAESISGLPTLGVIPLQSTFDKAVTSIAKAHLFKTLPRGNSEHRALISYLEPQSETAEAYRVVRTAILLSSVLHPPRSILITSAVPQDGKTMTCANVAIVLAQQAKRVLLVDADMRRPNIHKVFGVSGQVGLSNILTGGAKASDAIQTTVQPNLFVIPAGPIPPHPSELLSSSLMQDLIRKWRDEYDHVIIDSPPVISVTDAVLLSVQTDAVVMIIRSGETSAAHVRRTRTLLQSVKANLLGIVVNAANLSSPDYYYYDYGSKYRYYTEKRTKDRNTRPEEEQDVSESANGRGRDGAASRTS